MEIETIVSHIPYGNHMLFLTICMIPQGPSRLMEPICRYSLVLLQWHWQIGHSAIEQTGKIWLKSNTARYIYDVVSFIQILKKDTP